MNKSLTTFLALVVLAGCVVGRKLSFDNKEGGPSYAVTKSATIVFQDKRPNVLAAKSKPSLCAHTLSTAHIRYNVQTADGMPLADDFALSVSHSYSKAGAPAVPIEFAPRAPVDSILQVFKQGGKDRLLYFTIRKWDVVSTPLWSSIRYETVCAFDLNVYDKNGELLASAIVSDSLSNEEPSAASTIKELQRVADRQFSEKIGQLFNDEAVKKSL